MSSNRYEAIRLKARLELEGCRVIAKAGRLIVKGNPEVISRHEGELKRLKPELLRLQDVPERMQDHPDEVFRRLEDEPAAWPEAEGEVVTWGPDMNGLFYDWLLLKYADGTEKAVRLSAGRKMEGRVSCAEGSTSMADSVEVVIGEAPELVTSPDD